MSRLVMQHYWICDFMYSDTEWLVKIHICHKSKSNVPDVYQTCNIYLLSMNKTYSGDSSFCACSSPVPNWSCRQNARKRYDDNFCLKILTSVYNDKGWYIQRMPSILWFRSNRDGNRMWYATATNKEEIELQSGKNELHLIRKCEFIGHESIRKWTTESVI